MSIAKVTRKGSGIDFLKRNRQQVLAEAAGSWKTQGSGVEYVQKIRKGWTQRRKK